MPDAEGLSDQERAPGLPLHPHHQPLERLSPYYVEYATMRNFLRAHKDIRPSLFPENIESILRDRRFENIVAAKTGITTATLDA
jgi:heme oxygenase